MKRSIIIVLIGTITFSQSNMSSDIKLDQISFNINNLNINLSKPEPNIREASLSIGRINFGFSNLELMYNEYIHSGRSTFAFNGPDFTLSNLAFNISMVGNNPWEELMQELLPKNPTYEVKEMMLQIDMLCKSYEYYYDRYPDDINALVRDMNLLIPSIMGIKWKFEIINGQITATSLAGFEHGPGKVIIFEPSTESFRGYRQLDRSQYYQGISKNNITLNLGKIELLFSSNGSFDMNNSNQLLDFQIDKARFGVYNTKISIVHDNILLSKMVVKLSDFHIDLHDIFFEIDNTNNIPEINKFNGEIALNNLEIEIPNEILNKPELKKMALMLGVYSNILRIRKVDLRVSLINGNNYKLAATFFAPFVLINLDGNYTIYQQGNRSPDLYINNLTIAVRNLNPVLNEFIKQWEIENQQIIPRRAGSIFIELSGTPDNLQINGLDLDKIKF